MGVLTGRVSCTAITVVVLMLTVPLGVFGAGVVNTDTEQYNELKAEYQKFAERYPVARRQRITKLLSDNIGISKKRYAQEQSDSNLAGMASAKVALEILNQAKSDFEKTDDFELPGKIRHELQEFFNTIQKYKTDIEGVLDARKERLKNNTFSRFMKLAGEQISDETDTHILRQEFDGWIKDATEKEAEAEKAPEVKRVSAADLGLDLAKDDFANIKTIYKQRDSQIEALRKAEFEKLLENSKSEARKWYAEEKKVRNIKGMTISRKALEMVAEALSVMKKDGAFKLPPEKDLRPELQDYVRKLGAQKDDIAAGFAEKKRALHEEGLKRFSKLVLAQVGDISHEDMATVFGDWLLAKDSPSGQAGEEVGGKGPAVSGSAPDSPYFAEKGRCAKWLTVGHWRVESKGMDIFQVPIYGGADAQGSKRNPRLGSDSNWSYRHVAALEKNHFYAFRLKTIKGLRPVDVVEWPSLRNNWVLEVRTDRNAGSFGFEVQAGIIVDEKGRSVRKQLIAVPVVTKPAGARVYVDGERY